MATTTTAIQTRPGDHITGSRPGRLSALPWRDPHSVPQEKLTEFIASLKEACQQNPNNAEMRTCLGIAYAMNYDPQCSMDWLEEARRIEPENFFAQFKYSELLYRLRLIDRAEQETVRALELAGNRWQLGLARRQLSEIRQLKRKGLTRPLWTKLLKVPATLGFLLLLLAASWMYIAWR